MSVLAFLISAQAAVGIATPEFKAAELRSRLSVPLSSFFCDAAQPDPLGGKWASVEVTLTDGANLFGLNRRPLKDGQGSPRIDDRIVEYASVRHEDGGASIFFKPDAKYGVQFELRLAPPTNPPSNLNSTNLSGVLSRTDGSAMRKCMLVPNFSPVGSTQ